MASCLEEVGGDNYRKFNQPGRETRVAELVGEP
jgi:hypothetical protein